MIPKEQAKKLVEKFEKITAKIGDSNGQTYYAKQCALIAVELRLDGAFIFSSIEYGEESLEFWQQVKQEISLIN